MMTTSKHLLLSVLALAPASGCIADLDVGANTNALGGVDVYEKEFAWSEPEACQTFLHRRIYDEDARVVSYEALAQNHELTATYEADVRAPRPLSLELGDDRGTLLSLRASAEDLEVRDAHGEVVLHVVGYTEGRGETIVRTQRPVDAAPLALLSCTLPMRTELGYVPGFVRNIRDAIAPTSQGVGGSTSETAPLVSWNSSVSLLGAWLRQGLCLHAAPDGSLDWQCGCFEVRDPLVGVVRGDCDSARVEPSEEIVQLRGTAGRQVRE